MRFLIGVGLVLGVFGFSSCVVQAPKFTSVEKVLALPLDKTAEEVSELLGVPPYNFIFRNDTETVLLYKFRVNDRITLPFLLKETNGKKVRGRYVNLEVTYNNKGKSVRMRGCDDCDETIVSEKKLDFNKIVNILTVTLPIVAVFLGIRLGSK